MIKIDLGAIAGLAGVVMSLLAALVYTTKRLYAAVNADQVKAAINEGIASTQTLVDERHTEILRRLSNQDGSSLRIEDLIRTNDADNRKARHDLRDSLHGVGMEVAVIKTRVDNMDEKLEHLESKTDAQAAKLEELAEKVEKIQSNSTTVNVLGGVER